MRLINTITLELEDCLEVVPEYAILSHTWGGEEVSFQEWAAPGTRDQLLSLLDTLENEQKPTTHIDRTERVSHISGTERGVSFQDLPNLVGTQSRLNRFGYWKILQACILARRDSLGYLWVDTNCIDKTSSAELSEAINSMYLWYRSSAVCYAYLSDLVITDTNTGDLRDESLKSFRQSRWFRRGWTLQELLAPRRVSFFSGDWRFVGTKQTLAPLLAEITRMDEKYLLYAQDVRSASIAQRMAAVADRTTTRPEDIAYCLLGLFNVNMPLLYGEGGMAFVRLQEEIMKVSDDHSIFAWTWIADMSMRNVGKTVAEVSITRLKGQSLVHKPNFPANRLNALLFNRMTRPPRRPTLMAPDPVCFFDAHNTPTLKPPNSAGIFAMTNVGLSISLPIIHHPSKKLAFAMIHEEANASNDTLTAILIPLTPHNRYQDRWTRTCFPVAPITAVFQKRSGVAPTLETIQVCRDVQLSSFYFGTFGGTFHRFGFWLLFPQLQEIGRVTFSMQGGCVLGDGLYNDYGLFVNPDKSRGDQFIGGMLTFRMEAAEEDLWRCWDGKAIVLFLILGMKRLPNGEFRKVSHHCEISIRRQVPEDVSQLLERYLQSLQQKQSEHSGRLSTYACSDSFRDEPQNTRKYWSLDQQELTLHATVEFLNDEPLSHSPQSSITLTKLSCWHSEKRTKDFKLLGRGFTI